MRRNLGSPLMIRANVACKRICGCSSNFLTFFSPLSQLLIFSSHPLIFGMLPLGSGPTLFLTENVFLSGSFPSVKSKRKVNVLSHCYRMRNSQQKQSNFSTLVKRSVGVVVSAAVGQSPLLLCREVMIYTRPTLSQF